MAVRRLGLGLYWTREPVILAVLSVLTIGFFLAVSGLSRTYHTQQQSLANRWFTRGVADLKEQRFDRAVIEFRAALLYSRGNYDYQLNLAEALLGLHRTSEAGAYLSNLREQQPENGLVNLELARIAAQEGDTETALRYYHNATYAAWPSDQEVQRRNARLELIEFLLRSNANAQAQSELIALAANLGDDPTQQARVGNLFLRVHDYEHALAEYSLSLKSQRDNPPALAGAGLAAFELRQYDLAQRYLEAAVDADPGDAQSASRLKSAELVLQMDPFRRRLPASQRDRIVMQAFASAGQRLKNCGLEGVAGAPAAPQSLAATWTKMKPQITERGLRRDPDLVEDAMELVFHIERESKIKCGDPNGTDLALLLISKLHEGN